MGVTENDFLRDKSKTIRETEQVIMDVITGEIVSVKRDTVRTTSTEPDYIKIYYRAMMAINDIDEIPVSFLLGLSSHISFTNGDKIFFYSNKATRKHLCEICDVQERMISRYLKRSIEKGVLFETDARGIYEVNPWLIARGKWEHIRKLQAEFEFTSGKWKRTLCTKDTDSEDTEEPEGAENEQSSD